MERKGKNHKNLNISTTKRAFKMKWKTFFMVFKGLSFGEKIEIWQKIADASLKYYMKYWLTIACLLSYQYEDEQKQSDLCQSLFFNKVAGLRTHFLTEFIWWLLLESNVRETNIKGGKSGEIAGDECRTFYFFNDTINIKNAPNNIKRNGKPYKTILITVII